MATVRMARTILSALASQYRELRLIASIGGRTSTWGEAGTTPSTAGAVRRRSVIGR